MSDFNWTCNFEEKTCTLLYKYFFAYVNNLKMMKYIFRKNRSCSIISVS